MSIKTEKITIDDLIQKVSNYDDNKEELKLIKEEIIGYIESEFNMNIVIYGNNVVMKKNILLDEYINGSMNKDEYVFEYQKINKR